MKNKNIIYSVIVVFVTLIGLWAIPELVKIATYTNPQYPFGYYSSVKKKFLFRQIEKETEFKLYDDEGNIYEDKEFDASLPLLYFRQLMLNNEMPDSIDGIKIEMPLLRNKQINFRYTPRNKNTPKTGLYIMYESLPVKGRLESPGDLFRLTDRIEFIDAETNTINREKSQLFENALAKVGYTFPAQWTAGNMNIRKAYDEGYFSLDAEGKLFHIKMVNGRPFVRNTNLDSQIEPTFFSPVEPADKRFYGIIFDKKGYCYLLEEKNGKYSPLKLDIDPVDINKDEISIIGNFLYWTLTVQNSEGKHYCALKTETLEKVRYNYVEYPVNKWDMAASKLFPFYLTFGKNTSDYIVPQLHFTAYIAFIINVLTAILFTLVYPRRTKKIKIFTGLYVLIFGIAGAAALMLQWRKGS